ncbi:MAG TPA: hypothetical protein DCG48_13085, partial [Rhodospirillaceae bacterium]|nr:hypothetical protein [Rhodospirillaceae bacterium]
PSVLLAGWLYARTVDVQVADVSERSLLLAKTLSRFIEGYLDDFRESLDLLSTQYNLTNLPKPVLESAAARGMTAVCLLSGARRPVDVTVISGMAGCLPRDVDRMWRDIRARVPETGAGTVFSPVMADMEGDPAVFAVNFRAG